MSLKHEMSITCQSAAEVEDAARQSVMTSLTIQRTRVSTQHLKFILLLKNSKYISKALTWKFKEFNSLMYSIEDFPTFKLLTISEIPNGKGKRY